MRMVHRYSRDAMDRIPPTGTFCSRCRRSLGCAADLATKAWFFSWPELRAGEIYWLWPGHVGIQLSWNEGALFGIGQGKVWLFAALSIAAAIAIPVWLFRFARPRDAWLTFALGCVMAGVLGNLYDRLGLARRGLAAAPIRAPVKPSTPCAIGFCGKRTTAGAGRISTSPIRCWSSVPAVYSCTRCDHAGVTSR